jgi:membrane protein implicated in regulation of membrane protease activity
VALWQRRAWAWAGALGISGALIIWIGVEIAMVGYHADPPLQLIYGSLGVVLLILTLWPSVRRSLA